MTSRKSLSAAFWKTMVVVTLLVAYPLSFGPACWSTERAPMTYNRVAPQIYWPIGWLCSKSERTRKVFNWYATVRGPDYVLIVPANSSGATVVGMSRH